MAAIHTVGIPQTRTPFNVAGQIWAAFLKVEAGMALTERTGVAGLIVMTLVCAGGLLEGKHWALLVEALRLPVLGGAALIWTHRAFGLETVAGQVLAVLVVLDVAALMVWLMSHRQVLVRPYGPIESTADTVRAIEPERVPPFAETPDPMVRAE